MPCLYCAITYTASCVSFQAIKATAVAIMRMRPETISRQHTDMLNSTLDPIIAKAPEVLKQHESQNIAEDRLSLLYSDLVYPKATEQKQSLAQKMKNMAHVDLGATANKKVNRAKSGSFDEDDEASDGGEGSDGEEGEGRLSGSGRGSVGRARSATGGKSIVSLA
jgi:hypothetical protein